MEPLITAPGRYSGIPIEVYHGHDEICSGPSISSSGLKLLDKCPLKYWHQSPLNPNREERKTTRALDMGKAAHDVLGLGDAWPQSYFVTPEGFDARKTREQADWHAEVEQARLTGLTILSFADCETVMRMAGSLREHPLADALFSGGEAEVTLAWQDKETGVWLRARPDWLPDKPRIIPDYKSAADASPHAFQRSVDNYGYYISAALYLEGIEQTLGEKPRSFLFVVQEKDPPYIVQLYQLDEGARAWGEAINRRAIRKFADCLHHDRWPSYGAEIEAIDLPVYRNLELQRQADAGLLEYAT